MYLMSNVLQIHPCGCFKIIIQVAVWTGGYLSITQKNQSCGLRQAALHMMPDSDRSTLFALVVGPLPLVLFRVIKLAFSQFMRITRMSALSFTQSQHVIRGNNRIPLLLYHRIICLQIKHTLHTRGRRSRTICQALCHFIILPNPLPPPPSPPSVTTVGCVQRTALHKCVIIRKPTIHLLVLRDSSQGHTICGLILCVVPPI